MDFLPWLIAIVALAAALFVAARGRGEVAEDPAARAAREKISAERDAFLAEKIRLEKDLETRAARIAELEKSLETARTRVAELEEKGRGTFANLTKTDARAENLETELRAAREKITKFESEAARREADFAEKLEKLDRAEKNAEAARARLEREKIDAEERRIAERDRIWAGHENAVISRLRELCQRPEFGFPFFENTNLPAEFDGKLKPDAMIEVLGQLVVFDAKMSKTAETGGLATYLTANAKSTAKKYRGEKFYPTIFLVIPTIDLAGLPADKTYFYEDGIHLFVVGIEALPAILASFKKITTYEQIEAIDPLERENIVKVFAALDQHINLRNAYDILAAEAGARSLAAAESLSPAMRAAIGEQKKSIRLENFTPTAIKKLLGSGDAQAAAIGDLTAPRAAVPPAEQMKIGE